MGLVVLAQAALGTGAFAAPLAHAAPLRADAVLGLPTTGLGTAVSFPGLRSTQTLAIPVPAGLVPTAVEARVEMPPAIARGTIDVFSDERLLGRVELPSGVDARVSLPLIGALVEEGIAVISLRALLVPVEGQCVLDWRDPPLRLVDAAVAYRGEEAQPAAIANFLPPVLQTLTVYLPSEPSPAETQAAVQVSTAVVAHYRPQPVRVQVGELPPGEPRPDHAPGLLERQVAVREGGEGQLTLLDNGAPLLLLSGENGQLTDQVRLLTSDLSALAVTPRAAAANFEAPPQLPPTAQTLGQLGQGQLSATSIGQVSVTFGIDQTRLGRSARNVRVHLEGNYTPLPSSLNGRIAVSVGGQEIDSWPVAPDGLISRWVTVPDTLLGRFTTMTVTLQTVGQSTGCGLDQPVTLVISERTEVRSDTAAPPVPGGFASLPQALMPRLLFGLKDGGIADARRAVQIATGLQRLTPVPLAPELRDFDTAAAGTDPVVLIAASGGIPDSVRLPLTRVEESTLDVAVEGQSQSSRIVVYPGIAFGSLQVAFNGGRTVLAATSTGDPGDLDAILRWLEDDPTRWVRLGGDVVFQTGGRLPVTLSIAVEAPLAQQQAQSSTAVRAVAIVAAALAAAGLGAALVVLVRRVRRGRV